MIYVCLVVFTKLKPTVDVENRKRKESKHNSTKYQEITQERAKEEYRNKLQNREQLPTLQRIGWP